jgi:excinuclease UvrABC nuclease subunit
VSGRWVSYTLDSIVDMPEGPGCYVVYVDGMPSYVGQSVRVRERLWRGHRINYSYGSHIHTPWGLFREVAFKVKPSRAYGDWLMTEARLIRRLRPRFNRQGLRLRVTVEVA